jgi:hypothetical protein
VKWLILLLVTVVSTAVAIFVMVLIGWVAYIFYLMIAAVLTS